VTCRAVELATDHDEFLPPIAERFLANWPRSAASLPVRPATGRAVLWPTTCPPATCGTSRRPGATRRPRRAASPTRRSPCCAARPASPRAATRRSGPDERVAAPGRRSCRCRRRPSRWSPWPRSSCSQPGIIAARSKSNRRVPSTLVQQHLAVRRQNLLGARDSACAATPAAAAAAAARRCRPC
jgi:hypothetical protein